jgi:hypothetical protein
MNLVKLFALKQLKGRLMFSKQLNGKFQLILLIGVMLLAPAILAASADELGQQTMVVGDMSVKLGTWHRIGPFRDQGPLLNWMDNVASSFAYEFEVETDASDGNGKPLLDKQYPAPNFPSTPQAIRQWTLHTDWIDGYYQQLPRGPTPSAGESQYLYRTITSDRDGTIELDFIIRAPEADRRMVMRGMEYWRRTARYKCLLNGREITRWNGRGDMPGAKKVTLKAGINHFLAKVTNNRHDYGFAFSITGIHPQLRHEVGFERIWSKHILDLPTERPYCVEGTEPTIADSDIDYGQAIKRLRSLKFYPEPMPGVETAALDSRGRIVPAMEKALEKYPTSPAGDRHTQRLARLELKVKPLLQLIKETADPMETEVIAAIGSLEELWNQTISELPKLIYLERPTYEYDSMMYEQAGTQDAVIKSFDPATRQIETIFDVKTVVGLKVNEFNLSWDSKTIYMGGGGQVSAVNSDGTNFRFITSGQSPCEMPDSRLVFFDVDTGQVPCKVEGPRRLLFICDRDGKNRKVVSANTCIDTAPTVTNDGRVIFTRWDYGVNKNVFNRHALWTQNPDGTGMDLFFGNTVIDPRSFCRPRQIPSRPEVLTIFGPHHEKLAGLLGLVFNGAGREAADGLGFRRITHDTASVGDKPQVWSYQDPYPINEQLFLVSFGGRDANKTALYLYDRSGNRKCLLEAASDRGIHSAQPFAPRRLPPQIPDKSESKNWQAGEDLHKRLLTDPDWSQKSTLMLQDVYLGLEPEIKRGQIKYLAVMEQPAQSHARGGAMGVGTIWFANRVVGLVPVEQDGSAHFEVPALRSLFFHVLDKDGKMLMTQGSDFHTMGGEVRGCVGCHEQRKGIIAPPSNAHIRTAFSKPPVRPELPDWGTNGIIEYSAVVQPVLDKYCIKCHQGEKPDGRLNLTGDLTTAYSMSYMQLTDGMYVHFTPGTGATHAQPSNDYDEQSPLSRGSLLSPLTKYLQDPGHCGKVIPFEDQLKVFLWIDSNVPFYSHYRQGASALLSDDARAQLSDVHQRRCASCHDPKKFMPDERSGLNAMHIIQHVGPFAGPDGFGKTSQQWGIAPSGMRVRHINLSNPSHSAALLAPLSKKAGGWGLCKKQGQAIFNDRADADYKKALNAIKDGVVKQKGIVSKGIKELLAGNETNPSPSSGNSKTTNRENLRNTR